MSNRLARLGSEHPLCDSIQLIILILFFVTWGIDIIGKVIFGVSTIFVELVSIPLLLLPALFSWSLGIYLVMKSHEAIFGATTGQPMLNDSGVYSLVRHPMYLGIMLFCLGFLFIMPSFFSIGVWIVFFIFYDKMATYEENDLVRILGKKYINYQKRVPRWFPKLLHFSSKK